MTGTKPFATHWGTYRAESRDGRLVAVHDWEGDPDPAEIGPGILDMPDHPCRIRNPAVRQSFLENGPDGDRARRGAEPFVEVPWDEVLDLAASELRRVRDTHGPQAIFGGSYGWASAGRFHHAQSQVHRFLNMMGGYTASIDTYSFAAVSALAPHVAGHFRYTCLTLATSWDSIARDTGLIVAFGGLPLKNAQITSGGVGRHVMREALDRARANGCRIVSISPIRDDCEGAEWLSPRPGSDTALMLGLAHTLLFENLHDTAFLASHCTGWERVRAYIAGDTDGTPKTADWAAALTEIDADTIRGLARAMAASRTMLTVAWALQRADHGEQPCWMGMVLAAMLGQIGLPGGGFGWGYGSENGIGNPHRPLRFAALPQGQNPCNSAIPVARISDALLNPGDAYHFNGEARTYPDLRLIYWTGGNPFHHHQDLNRLVRALQRPETVIVNEIWWTPMARHADIVFPATMMIERNDLAMTHWEPLITANQRAIDPPPGARDDYDIFAGLAAKLGFGERFTEGRTAEDWLRHLWDQSRQSAAQDGVELPSLDTLREDGHHSVSPPDEPHVQFADFRADPGAHPLATPSGRFELFSEAIAGFGYADCPGHPVWLEPKEWLGNATRYPLHLISNQPRSRLHSQFDPGRVSQASKIAGREPLTMHPDDAAARGLKAGDVVRVHNGRGACLAGLRLSDGIRRGVVQLSTGAWHDPEERGQPGSLCKHGNPNVLTRDEGTSSLGQGPSAHSCLVEVSPLDGPPPPVTAYDPPRIITQK